MEDDLVELEDELPQPVHSKRFRHMQDGFQNFVEIEKGEKIVIVDEDPKESPTTSETILIDKHQGPFAPDVVAERPGFRVDLKEFERNYKSGNLKLEPFICNLDLFADIPDDLLKSLPFETEDEKRNIYSAYKEFQYFHRNFQKARQLAQSKGVKEKDLWIIPTNENKEFYELARMPLNINWPTYILLNADPFNKRNQIWFKKFVCTYGFNRFELLALRWKTMMERGWFNKEKSEEINLDWLASIKTQVRKEMNLFFATIREPNLTVLCVRCNPRTRDIDFVSKSEAQMKAEFQPFQFSCYSDKQFEKILKPDQHEWVYMKSGLYKQIMEDYHGLAYWEIKGKEWKATHNPKIGSKRKEETQTGSTKKKGEEKDVNRNDEDESKEEEKKKKKKIQPGLYTPASIWLDWIGRRSYSHRLVDPIPVELNPPDFIPSYFNDWCNWAPGFTFEDLRKDFDPGLFEEIEPFLHHLKYNCCADDEEYNFLLGWIAHLVQLPWVKTEVAILLGGAQGTGKSKILAILMTLLGKRHAIVLSSSQDFKEGWTGHLVDKNFIGVEETSAFSKEIATNIKAEITGDESRLRVMRQDPLYVPNLKNFWFNTNDVHSALHPDGTHRRYAMFHSSVDASLANVLFKKQVYQVFRDEYGREPTSNQEAYTAWVNYMEGCLMANGGRGYRVLMYFFMSLPINKFPVRQVPMTAMRVEHIISGLPSVQAWWLEILLKGYNSVEEVLDPMTGNETGKKAFVWVSEMDVSAAFQSYKSIPKRRYEDKGTSDKTEMMFRTEFLELVPGMKMAKQTMKNYNKKATERIYFAKIPSLEKCIDFMSKKTPALAHFFKNNSRDPRNDYLLNENDDENEEFIQSLDPKRLLRVQPLSLNDYVRKVFPTDWYGVNIENLVQEKKLGRPLVRSLIGLEDKKALIPKPFNGHEGSLFDRMQKSFGNRAAPLITRLNPLQISIEKPVTPILLAPCSPEIPLERNNKSTDKEEKEEEEVIVSSPEFIEATQSIQEPPLKKVKLEESDFTNYTRKNPNGKPCFKCGYFYPNKATCKKCEFCKNQFCRGEGTEDCFVYHEFSNCVPLITPLIVED